MCVLVKNALMRRFLHFPHCWSAFYHPVGCAVTAVICGTTAVTWFGALANQRHSAFSIPHFTFRIPHSAIPHFTHSLGGMTKYRVDRILLARRPINYRVDRGTMIMTC